MLEVVIPVIVIAFVPDTKVALPAPSKVNEAKLLIVVPLAIVSVADVAGAVMATLLMLVAVAVPTFTLAKLAPVKGAYLALSIGGTICALANIGNNKRN